MSPAASLWIGRTTHRREHPFTRAFSYPIAMIDLDIDRLAEADGLSRLFSVGRPNAVALRPADHGERRKDASLRAWAEARFAEAGVQLEGGAVRLAAFPRVLGAGFSPLSLWFGHGPDGALRGVIFEVRNTFGEAHAYVCAFTPGQRPEADKEFHVSPFFNVSGRYRFTLREPGERLDLVVENLEGEKRVHVATITARRREFSGRTLLAWLLRMPFSGAGVILAIHWQALSIWLRRAGYRDKPAQRANRTTIASAQNGSTASGERTRKRA